MLISRNRIVAICLLLLVSAFAFGQDFDYWSYVRTYFTDEHPVGEPVTVEVTLIGVDNFNGVWVIEAYTKAWVVQEDFAGYVGGIIGILVYGSMPQFEPGTLLVVHLEFNDVWVRCGVLTPVFMGIDYE